MLLFNTVDFTISENDLVLCSLELLCAGSVWLFFIPAVTFVITRNDNRKFICIRNSWTSRRSSAFSSWIASTAGSAWSEGILGPLRSSPLNLPCSLWHSALQHLKLHLARRPLYSPSFFCFVFFLFGCLKTSASKSTQSVKSVSSAPSSAYVQDRKRTLSLSDTVFRSAGRLIVVGA